MNPDLYRHYSQKWHWQPVIGADADTFHGNSGGPAFDKKRHRVIGLLIEGESDTSAPWRPGWQRHEGILSMFSIIEQIEVAKKDTTPNWQVAELVCVWGNDNDPDQLIGSDAGHKAYCQSACNRPD